MKPLVLSLLLIASLPTMAKCDSKATCLPHISTATVLTVLALGGGIWAWSAGYRVKVYKKEKPLLERAEDSFHRITHPDEWNRPEFMR